MRAGSLSRGHIDMKRRQFCRLRPAGMVDDMDTQAQVVDLAEFRLRRRLRAVNGSVRGFRRRFIWTAAGEPQGRIVDFPRVPLPQAGAKTLPL